MCGFTGFAFAEDSSVAQAERVISSMMGKIEHRGPNSAGVYAGDHATFGFRRLSIIDLSDDGMQPMYNEDRSLVLVFNGEIYNFMELREELSAKGHRFASRTDSEVILHGYEEYGIELLGRLRGMFAFALWDERQQSLLMARDPFGIKPLYYSRNTTDGALLFGSEIKAFTAYPFFRKELNKEALKPYLTFQYSVLDETFFKGVYKLKPGHYMLCHQDGFETKPYSKLKFDSEPNTLEFHREQIRHTMRDSVECHRMGDVKVGSFLSGGVDSSYLTALLRPDKTFSVGFEAYQDQFNETHLAKELSNQLSIENYAELLTAEQCFAKLSDIQYHMDEPHANPSCIPLYFLAELASRHVTVVLSGEGADEIFGGYDWYDTTPAMKKYSRLPFSVRRIISSTAKRLPRNRISSFLIRGGEKVEERFIGQARVWEESDALAILKEEYAIGPSVHNITAPIYREIENADDLTKMQYLDLKLWLPGDILLKADKMSMAHSIELRVPFLDRMVMNAASRLPSELRVKDGETKRALRAAAREELPEAWAKRPKVGFPVPIRHWLREEKYYLKVRELFASDMAASFFLTESLLKQLDEHYAGVANHARQVWTVYVFLVWYDRYFEVSSEPRSVLPN
jgi:asparagine synthase (glutamine-hydrolysing)